MSIDKGSKYGKSNNTQKEVQGGTIGRYFDVVGGSGSS